MLLNDFIAGMTIALMLIPQGNHFYENRRNSFCFLLKYLFWLGLAYSKLAGLPVQYGLYSSWLGVLAYVFLGTSKDISVGPTAIMGLMIARAIPLGIPESEVFLQVHLAFTLRRQLLGLPVLLYPVVHFKPFLASLGPFFSV